MLKVITYVLLFGWLDSTRAQLPASSGGVGGDHRPGTGQRVEQSLKMPKLSKPRRHWDIWHSSIADKLINSKNPDLLRKARLNYVTRGIQYAWVKYAANAFGAAEVNPMTGRTQLSERSAVPYMILDNIEILHMIGWTSEVQRILRWLELGTIFSEILSTNDPDTQSYCSYCYYRQVYQQALEGNMKGASSEEVVVDEVEEEEVDNHHCHHHDSHRYDFAELKELIDKFLRNSDEDRPPDKALENLVDRYFPPLEMERSERSSHSAPHPTAAAMRNTTEDLLLLRSSFYGIYALQSEEISSFFETTIRGLGGLLGAWRLVGHPILAYSAWTLGHRLAHNLFFCDFAEGWSSSPSKPCLPPRHVSFNSWNRLAQDLEHGNCSFNSTSPNDYITTAAVVMSNQLEFAALSDMLGICDYYDASLRTMRQFLKPIENTELLTRDVSVQKSEIRHLSTDVPDAESDSAYEYLVKLHNLDDTISHELRPRITQIFKMLTSLVRSINSTDPLGGLVPELPMDSIYRKPDFKWLHRAVNRINQDGASMTFLKPVTSHLACFAGGLFILASEILQTPSREQTRNAAFSLTNTCFHAAASKPGCLAPEDLIDDYSPIKLRPEILESLYYASISSESLNSRRAYEDKIWKLTEAVLTQTRKEFGFCNYNAAQQSDQQCQQESWLLSETFKYAAMTFGLRATSDFSLESLRNSSRAATRALLARRSSSADLLLAARKRSEAAHCGDSAESIKRRERLIKYLNLAPDDPRKFLTLKTTDLAPGINSTLRTQNSVDLKLHSDVQMKKIVDGSVFTTEAHLLWPLNLTAASCIIR